MLLSLFIAVTLAGVAAGLIIRKLCPGVDIFGWVTAGTGLIGVIVCCVFIGMGNIGADTRVEDQNAKRADLIYQWEHTEGDKTDLYYEIVEWNENISYYKYSQDSPYFGIFIPDVYDEIEPIIIAPSMNCYL